jgi:hypothetical protein
VLQVGIRLRQDNQVAMLAPLDCLVLRRVRVRVRVVVARLGSFKMMSAKRFVSRAQLGTRRMRARPARRVKLVISAMRSQIHVYRALWVTTNLLCDREVACDVRAGSTATPLWPLGVRCVTPASSQVLLGQHHVCAVTRDLQVGPGHRYAIAALRVRAAQIAQNGYSTRKR